MADRVYASYDVLDKRGTLSWNDATRAALDERMALQVPDGVLEETQLKTLHKLAARICPDPDGRPPTSSVAMIVRRIRDEEGDGFRHHALPRFAECWRRALDAVQAEAHERFGKSFADLPDDVVDRILHDIQQGHVQAEVWSDLPPELIWNWRIVPDLVSAHWAQPQLWSAMGFGGPASPRGYVRLALNRRDPWEPKEEGAPMRGLPRHHD